MAARIGLSPDLFGARSDAAERLSALRGCMQRIGGQLLEVKAQRESWSEEDCIRNSLGYGGLQQLVVFEHNVPTATVTALWKSGLVSGKQWTPLFPRKSGGKVPALDDFLDHRYPNLDGESYEHILKTFKQRSYSVYQANGVVERLLAARQSRGRSAPSDLRRDFDALIDSEPPRLV